MRRLNLLALIQVVLVLLLAATLAAASAAGAFRLGLVPAFRHFAIVGPLQALVVENGPFCVDGSPLPSCYRGVRQQFRVWYMAGDHSHELITYTWRS